MADTGIDTEINAAEPEVREADGTISAKFVEMLSDAIEASDGARVLALAGDLHTADVADLLESLPGDLRGPFVRLLGATFDFAVLTEVDEGIRDQLLEFLSAKAVAEGVAELDSDDAVYILEDLEPAEREEILQQLPAPDRAALKRNLDYPEEFGGPPHAVGVYRRAAILDRRADHRPHARGRRSAGRLL